MLHQSQNQTKHIWLHYRYIKHSTALQGLHNYIVRIRTCPCLMGWMSLLLLSFWTTSKEMRKTQYNCNYWFLIHTLKRERCDVLLSGG